jgi:hypothetical protein
MAADVTVPDWTAVVGALIAVYAATVSTWQAIRSIRDERPRLRVTMRLGRMLNAPGDNDSRLVLNYVNVGKIPVSIASLPAIKLHTLKGHKLVLHEAKYALPYRLETYAENESWVYLRNLSDYIDWNAVENGAEYWILGEVTDASGKNHRSVPHVLYRPKRRETEIVVGTPDAANGAEVP